MDDMYSLLTAPKMSSNMKWGAGIILQDPETKRILLAKRVDNGRYGCPGGTVEYNEKPIDAILRETLEESNIKVNSMSYYDSINHNSPNGEWTSFLFYSDDFDASDVINQQTEMSEWGWYDTDAVNNLSIDNKLFEPCEMALEIAKEKGILSGNSYPNIPFVECPSSGFAVKDSCPCAYSYQEPEKVFINNSGLYWD